MEKENTDSAKFEKKNIEEEKLSDENFLLKKLSKKTIENIRTLLIIIFYISLFLIYLIGFFRRFVTWIIFAILNMVEIYPNLLTFTLQLIGITKLLFNSDKSKLNYLFGFIIAFFANFVLNKILLLYIPDHIIIYMVKILKKIYFICHIILSLYLADRITFLVKKYIFKKKAGKIYTSADKEDINNLLEANETLFILYSEASDQNNKFYMKELSKISSLKKGKYTFIMINYISEFDKRLYSLFFTEKNDQPKFGYKKGNKKELMKQFPEKGNFSKQIKDFVDKHEHEEFNEKINKNGTNNKEEEEKKEEKDKDREKKEEKEKEKDKEEEKDKNKDKDKEENKEKDKKKAKEESDK